MKVSLQVLRQLQRGCIENARQSWKGETGNFQQEKSAELEITPHPVGEHLRPGRGADCFRGPQRGWVRSGAVLSLPALPQSTVRGVEEGQSLLEAKGQDTWQPEASSGSQAWRRAQGSWRWAAARSWQNPTEPARAACQQGSQREKEDGKRVLRPIRTESLLGPML